nr:cyclase family protein [Motilibacter aurantiacus]
MLDLSHPITDGMVTYPGLDAPVVRTVVDRQDSARRLAPGVSFEILGVDLVANTGTYLDAPRHFHAAGADIASLPLERLVDVPVTLVDVRGDGPVDAARLAHVTWERGRAILLWTGWSRHWGSPAYVTGGPFVTADAVQVLLAAEPALVGIDALNIDSPADPARPAHCGLLHAGVPIVEHLTGLDELHRATGGEAGRARLTALPAPFAQLGTFPVRAVASVSGT